MYAVLTLLLSFTGLFSLMYGLAFDMHNGIRAGCIVTGLAAMIAPVALMFI